MLDPRFVRFHKLSVALVIFLVLMGILHTVKPALVYDRQGRFREFGLGYRNCTVFPIWLMSVLLAIFSYAAVLWYVTV